MIIMQCSSHCSANIPTGHLNLPIKDFQQDRKTKVRLLTFSDFAPLKHFLSGIRGAYPKVPCTLIPPGLFSDHP